MSEEINSTELYAEDVGFTSKSIEDSWGHNDSYEENLVRQKLYAMDLSLIPEEKRLIQWSDLNKKEFPENRWRIKNLIPHEGFVILSSISGEKKTWIALEMARCISHGIDFLEIEQFKTTPANVLYVDGENPQAEMQKRGRQLGFKEDSFNKISFYSVDDLNLSDEDQVDKFIEMIKEKDFKVIFIDTMRAVAGALKEDKAEDVRQFFNRFKKLKDEGIVIVFLDHLRKPSNLDGKVPKKEHLLGSQDKTASIEVLLMLKSDSGSNEINLYQRKNRLGREIPAFQILMEDIINEDNSIHTVFNHNGELDSEENKKDEAKEIILEVLSDNQKRTTKEILEITRKQAGQKNTRLALRELVTEGLINQSRAGKQNLYGLINETIEKSTNDFFNGL
jgi:hypothetical protein